VRVDGNARKVAARLERSSRVAYAEPNKILRTSIATPHASAVAAVIRTLNSGLTAAQVVARLDAAVDDKGAGGRDPSFGFGRVNLLKATTG
jgi:subtilisin family serine protease